MMIHLDNVKEMAAEFVHASEAHKEGLISGYDWKSYDFDETMKEIREALVRMIGTARSVSNLNEESRGQADGELLQHILAEIEMKFLDASGHIRGGNVRSSLIRAAQVDRNNPKGNHDKYLRLESNPGSIFLPVHVDTGAVGLVRRFRPQVKDGVTWEQFIAGYPESIDMSLLGRDALTAPRWFGGQGSTIEKVMLGQAEGKDPRMLKLHSLSDAVVNDASDINPTHYGVAVIDPEKPAGHTEFSNKLTKLLQEIQWYSREDIKELLAKNDLQCQFTHTGIMKAEWEHPEIFPWHDSVLQRFGRMGRNVWESALRLISSRQS